MGSCNLYLAEMNKQVILVLCLYLVTPGRGLSLGFRSLDKRDVGEERSPRHGLGFLTSLFHNEPVHHSGHVTHEVQHYDPHYLDSHHADPHHDQHHYGKRSARPDASPGYGYGYGGYGHNHHGHHHHHHCDYFGHGHYHCHDEISYH